MGKKPSIFFVIGSFGLGGAERQLNFLLQSLRELNYNCHLFVLDSQGPLGAGLEDGSITVYDADYSPKSTLIVKFLTLIRAQVQLIRVLNKVKPDVLHAFLPLANFLAAMAGRLSGVPLIISSRRALGTHQERNRGWRIFDIISFYLSHRVTVNSHAVAADTIKRDAGSSSKIVLIYNGIDAATFKSVSTHRSEVRQKLGIPLKDKVIITVANLIPYKGHADLFEAFALVFKRFPDSILLLVGEDRGIHKDLEKKAHLLGIQEKIRFVGQCYDIPDLMAAADLSVLPSHEEGFSNVILESMAAGLPIVATNVGGNPEAVIDGVTGRLAPAHNPVILAEKMIDLLGNPEKAKLWGNQGKKRVVEMFSIDKMINAHLKLYRRC